MTSGYTSFCILIRYHRDPVSHCRCIPILNICIVILLPYHLTHLSCTSHNRLVQVVCLRTEPCLRDKTLIVSANRGDTGQDPLGPWVRVIMRQAKL